MTLHTLQKSSYNASEVIMLDEGIEYMKHSETISKTKKLGTPTPDKKKKKTAGKFPICNVLGLLFVILTDFIL